MHGYGVSKSRVEKVTAFLAGLQLPQRDTMRRCRSWTPSGSGNCWAKSRSRAVFAAFWNTHSPAFRSQAGTSFFGSPGPHSSAPALCRDAGRAHTVLACKTAPAAGTSRLPQRLSAAVPAAAGAAVPRACAAKTPLFHAEPAAHTLSAPVPVRRQKCSVLLNVQVDVFNPFAHQCERYGLSTQYDLVHRFLPKRRKARRESHPAFRQCITSQT